MTTAAHVTLMGQTNDEDKVQEEFGMSLSGFIRVNIEPVTKVVSIYAQADSWSDERWYLIYPLPPNFRVGAHKIGSERSSSVVVSVPTKDVL